MTYIPAYNTTVFMFMLLPWNETRDMHPCLSHYSIHVHAPPLERQVIQVQTGYIHIQVDVSMPGGSLLGGSVMREISPLERVAIPVQTGYIQKGRRVNARRLHFCAESYGRSEYLFQYSTRKSSLLYKPLVLRRVWGSNSPTQNRTFCRHRHSLCHLLS